MVGKSVSEKLAEKKAAEADDGFEKVVVTGGSGEKNFLSFSHEPEGFALVGTFEGINEGGTYGPEAMVRDADGIVQVFVLTAGLKGPMAQVNFGDTVKIIHLGLEDSKNFKGKQFRKFDVLVKRRK